MFRSIKSIVDFVISSPSNGQVLAYETASGKWKNQTPSGGSGGVTATTVEKDLGATAKCSGKFTITDVEIDPTSKVVVWQAPGPYTGKGTRGDEAAMQPVSVVAVEPGSGVCTVHWQTPPMITMKRETQDGRRNIVGATFDRLDNQRWPDVFVPTRIGKVRGNVKFTYIIYA